MSYYNQTDHEILDRRDQQARQILLRLARARVLARDPASTQFLAPSDRGDSQEGRWLSEASRRGIPAPDSEPLVAGDRSVRWVWRKHYVAVVIDSAERHASRALEDLGFDVIQFEDPVGWNAAFTRLGVALGRDS
jgi:hypothetical protein